MFDKCVCVCFFFCGYISDVLRHCGSVSIKLKLTRACFKIQRLNIGQSMRWSWVTVLLTNLSECNSLWGFFRKRWAYWCIGNHTWPMYTRAWMQTLFLYMKNSNDIKWTALHSSSSPQPSVLCGTSDREDDLSLSFSMKVQCLNVSVPNCLLPHRWSMRRWIDDYGTLWKKCRSFWIHWMNRTGREVGSVY